MGLEEHLIRLAKRYNSKVGNIIAAYETEDWPTGRLEELIDMRILKIIPNAVSIRCRACDIRCPDIVPIKEIANDGSEYYMILCEKEGCVDISEFDLKRWQITDKVLSFVPKKQRRVRLRSSNLTPKQELVYTLIHIKRKTQSEAAFEMKCTPQNISKLLALAEAKMGLSKGKSINSSYRLPEDKRGQVNACDDEL